MKPQEAAPDQEGYDEVVVHDNSGSSRTLSRAAFQKLPLSERIQHILNKTTQFRLRGQVIPSRVALKGG